jgi:hypothetical protein
MELAENWITTKRNIKMILDSAETVIGYFGFDRIVYGNKKNIGPRKWRWLQELRQESENDIRTEVI